MFAAVLVIQSADCDVLTDHTTASYLIHKATQYHLKPYKTVYDLLHTQSNQYDETNIEHNESEVCQ